MKMLKTAFILQSNYGADLTATTTTLIQYERAEDTVEQIGYYTAYIKLTQEVHKITTMRILKMPRLSVWQITAKYIVKLFSWPDSPIILVS